MFKQFTDRYGYVYLGEIQRQKNGTDRDIAKQLAHGDIASAVDIIASSGGFKWSKTKDEAILCAVEKWAEDRFHFPYSTSIIIAHTNQEVRKINDLIHAYRMERGEVGKNEFDCRTISGNIRLSEGDLIEFRLNDKKLKVNNGDIGVLVKASENEFVVSLETRKISFNPNYFTAFQLAYATTNYRSQGGTYDNAYVVYDKNMSQKLFYVARTRHRNKAYCFVSKTEANSLIHLKSQIARRDEKHNTVSYTTQSEMESLKRMQERKEFVKELCESDSLLSKAKGMSLKTWDSVSSGISSFVQGVQDIQSDRQFYFSHEKTLDRNGKVFEVKEANHDKEKALTKPKQSERSKAFQNLMEEKKKLYRNYFEKSDRASCLYAIVQSESEALSMSKDKTNGYNEWQKSCLERNQAAFELLRGNKSHKAIIGEKGYEILVDRSARYEQHMKPKESIEQKLIENMDTVLYALFPEGPKRSDAKGFRFGSKGGLLVTCVGEKKGCYYDFSNQEGGGLLSLVERKLGLARSEAIKWANNLLIDSSSKSIPRHFSVSGFSKQKDESWVSLAPPNGKPIPTLNSLSPYLDTHYLLRSSHAYKDQSGNIIFYTLRLESKTDWKKIVLPLSYGQTHPGDESSWKLKNHQDKHQVLYNGYLLPQLPHKSVLVVEGEKTADAATNLLGKDYIVVTWLGGASAANKANWNLLAGREVIIWPDNDSAGFKAANDICRSLRAVGVKSLKMISQMVIKEMPQKWDLADPLPTGKSHKFITDCLLRAESQAIGLDRLQRIADQHGLAVRQLNNIVCKIDNQLREGLEKIHGSKIWEIEAAILSEVNKEIQDGNFRRNLKAIDSQETGRPKLKDAERIRSIDKGSINL